MATVSKTLTWQATFDNVDYYQIGISTSPTGTPTVVKTTTDANTTTIVEYDSTTYSTAWLFVRAIATNGDVSEWSSPVSSTSLTPTYTPPQPLQYAYANDLTDALVGFTIPSSITTRMLNKACLEASREIDRITGRRFWQQTVVEKYDGNGTSELTLNHYPIIQVNYAQVNTGSGLEIIRTYTSSDLELSDFESGILTLKPVTVDNLDTSWQTATSLLYGHVFPQGKSNITVSYKYGYLEYTEGETLNYTSEDTNGTSGVVSRHYQAIHHNWASNNISVYQNGSLLTSGYSVDPVAGIVTVNDGAADDVITANYYHTVPHDIEFAAAKLAAINIINQISANETGGLTSFRNMNYQETYGSRPYNQVLSELKQSVYRIAEGYKRFDMYAV